MIVKKGRFYYCLFILFSVTTIFSCKDDQEPSADVSAPTLNWSKVSDIFGGTIYALASKDNNLFAGTDKGLFISTNNGSTWTAVSLGSGQDAVTAITVANNSIFVGTTANGLFFSSDLGKSWLRGQGLVAGKINSIAASGDYAFAAVDNIGVFYSKDKGQNWTHPQSNFEGHFEALIAVDGTVVSDLGNSDFGVSNWIFNPLNDGSGLTIQCLTLNGNSIYAGTNRGVYVSNNKGSTWASLKGNLPGGVSIHSLVINGNTIFAGAQYNIVYRSTDGGTSWTNVSSGLPVVSGAPLQDVYFYIPSLTMIGDALFAGTFGLGVYKSTNNGLSWSLVSTGLTNLKVTSLAVKNNELIALASPRRNTLYQSFDFGSTWSLKSTTNVPESNKITICGDNIILNKVYGDYFVSQDGVTWSALTGSTWSNDADIFIIAEKENMLLASDFNSVQNPSGAAYLSIDCGSTWKPLSVPALTYAGVITESSLIISTTIGVFVSNDKGLSWTNQSEGLFSSSNIAYMILKGDKIIAASASGRIFSTDIKSFKWIEVESDLPRGLGNTIYDVVLYKDVIIAGVGGKGIYLSADDGSTWVAQNSGHPANLQIEDLVILNENLFLVDESGIMYKSEVIYN